MLLAAGIAAGVVPAVASDAAHANVRTPAGTASPVWYTNLPGVQPVSFGSGGDVPLFGDMNGDGRDDKVIHRPDEARFYWNPDALGVAQHSVLFGVRGDIGMVADVTGDGRAELVAYRGATQQFFYGDQTGRTIATFSFGNPDDKPVMGNWFGGSVAEPGLFRPSTMTWYLGRNATGGAKFAYRWGNTDDVPLSARYNGVAQPALYRPSTRQFFVGGGTP
jgi:hypothetical protein